jgi:hypothetical protein
MPELLKRRPAILNRMLGHGLRNQPHPRKLLPVDGIELPAQSGFVGLSPRLVLPLPLGQCPVVNKVGDTHRLPQ